MATTLPRRSLALDFAKDGQASGDNYPDELSKLDSLLTFSRASIATRFNASGVLETVAAGQPRFDYDPVTLKPRGLLLEEQRTNLLRYSDDFTNGAWAVGAGCVATGVNNLSLPNATSSVTQITPCVANTAYTWSVELSGSGTISLLLSGNSNLNVLSAPITLTATPTRYSISGTTGASDSQLYSYIYRASGTATSVQARRAQLEVGAFATSYIPTTSAAVTRAAELVSTNSVTPWASSDFTLLADFERSIASGNAMVVGALTTYPAPTYLAFCSGGSMYNRFPSTNEKNTGLAAIAGRSRFAISCGASGSYAYALNGSLGSPRTDASKAALGQLSLGSYNSSDYWLNGWIRSVSFLPHAVSDLLLKQLTT